MPSSKGIDMNDTIYTSEGVDRLILSSSEGMDDGQVCMCVYACIHAHACCMYSVTVLQCVLPSCEQIDRQLDIVLLCDIDNVYCT